MREFVLFPKRLKVEELGCSTVSLEADMASIVSLTLLLILMKIGSSANQKSPTSPASTYLWIISSPSLAIWLGWISIAFIFDANKYLLVKGKCIILSSFWKIKSFLTLSFHFFRLGAAIVVLAVHFPVFAELVFRVEERVSKIFPTERGWAPGMLPWYVTITSQSLHFADIYPR